MRKTTLLADSVLALIEWMASDEINEASHVEPYANGRERGWAVYFNGKVAVFSENRNSDQIVVYKETFADFAMGGKIPSDKSYKGARYFSCTDSYEAAEFVLEYLTKE